MSAVQLISKRSEPGVSDGYIAAYAPLRFLVHEAF